MDDYNVGFAVGLTVVLGEGVVVDFTGVTVDFSGFGVLVGGFFTFGVAEGVEVSVVIPGVGV